MANLAYVRVSTAEQNEARQIEALQNYKIDKWFQEKVPGKNADRPELKRMLEYAREGDTIYIHDFSRLARNTKDLLEITEELERKGIALVSYMEKIDSSTATGKLMLTMIAAIAEFERQNLLERQREGIAIAKRAVSYTHLFPLFAAEKLRQGPAEGSFTILYLRQAAGPAQPVRALQKYTALCG